MSSEIGEYFGYPKCCIDSYLGPDSALNRAARFEDVPFGETGFVPCHKCATERTEEDILAEIASRRKCPTPFPDDSGAQTYFRNLMRSVANDPATDGHYKSLHIKSPGEW